MFNAFVIDRFVQPPLNLFFLSHGRCPCFTNIRDNSTRLLNLLVKIDVYYLFATADYIMLVSSCSSYLIDRQLEAGHLFL